MTLLALLQEETPSQYSIKAREDLLQRVNAVVQKGLGKHTGFSAKPYGSYLSGISTPAADLDVSIEATIISSYASSGLSHQNGFSE